MGIKILCVASIVVGNIYEEQDYDDLGDTFIASGVLYLVLGWEVSMMDAYTSAQNINRQIYLSPAMLNLQPINTPDGFGARLAFEF